MAGLLEYTKNGQVTEPPLYRFMKGNVQSFLNSIPDPSKMTPEQQLAMGLNANPIMGLLGTTAYHGSPYLFDKFDINKVGKGEGMQVYGHGIYFAENPKVAESYAESVKDTEKLGKIWEQVEYAKKQLNNAIKTGNTEEAIKFRDLRDKLWNVHSQNNMSSKGNVYTVDIPNEYIPDMLNWDKPLKEQNFSLLNYVDNIPPSKRDTFTNLVAKAKHNDMTVGSFYEELSKELGSAQKASEYLQKAGVPGIKYLDEGSRGMQAGTQNFVVFDPSQVKILERNNKGLLK